MAGLYVYWFCFTIIYFIIAFFIFKNKENRNNYEIIYPLFSDLYLAASNDVVQGQIVYLQGGTFILILLYFLALDIYRKIYKKENEKN